MDFSPDRPCIDHLRETLHKVLLGWLWSLGWFWGVNHLLELLVADPTVAVAVGDGKHVGDVLVGDGHGQVVHDVVEVLLKL